MNTKVDHPPKPEAPRSNKAYSRPEDVLRRPMLLAKGVSTEMTFERFITCQANIYPVELAKAIARADRDTTDTNPFFLHAGIGLGKTHLLYAMANATDRHNPLYLNMVDFEIALRQANLVTNGRTWLRQKLTSAGMLLIDDIQTCQAKAMIQQELTAVVDQMIRKKKPIVISSNLPLGKLKDMNLQLLSRLSSGVTAYLAVCGRRERRQILRMQPCSLTLPTDVLNFIAEQITDNIRRLIATGRQLAALRRFGNQQINIQLADNLLRKANIPTSFDPDPIGRHPADQPHDELPGDTPRTDKAARFKKMLEGAETEEEQALALQIALSERLRQLREEQSNPNTIQRLEQALNLLREGEVKQALCCIGEPM